jgi:hypothetical protein
MSGIVKNLEAAAKTMNLEKVLLLLSGVTKLSAPGSVTDCSTYHVSRADDPSDGAV